MSKQKRRRGIAQKQTVSTNTANRPIAPTTVHPAAAWCRNIGLASCLLGGSGLITSYFWVGVVLTYAGLMLLTIDLNLEPWFRSHRRLRAVVTTVFVAIAILFSLRVVLVSAALETTATTVTGLYPEGTVLGGIEWNSAFGELRITLRNPTRNDYNNIDLLLQPDEPQVKIGQLTSIPGVSFIGAGIGDSASGNGFDGNNILQTQDQQLIEKGKDGKNDTKLVPELRVMTGGYRMRCPLLPSSSSLVVVMAVARPTGQTKDEVARGYVATIYLPSGGRVADALQTASPTTVKVAGTYVAALRTHSIDRIIPVENR